MFDIFTYKKKWPWVTCFACSGTLSLVFGTFFIYALIVGCPMSARNISLRLAPEVIAWARGREQVGVARCLYDGLKIADGIFLTSGQEILTVRLTQGPGDVVLECSLYAGASWKDRFGHRWICLNPFHSDLDSRTLAHEIGHHCAGQPGCVSPLPGLGELQNAAYDMWIDVPLWLKYHIRHCSGRDYAPPQDSRECCTAAHPQF